MKKFDYMKPTGIHRLKIKDRTHKNGVPTWSKMERLIAKIKQHA